MGAHGLYFNLTVVGANGIADYDKIPATSGLGLSITNSGNIATVMLTGPKQYDSSAQASLAVPTTFTLYSDAGKSNKVYSFTIGKWFIAGSGSSSTYNSTLNYCRSIRYRIPGIAEYTNANYWTGGLSGQPNNYQRRIGGGLFAEWGDTHSGHYHSSSFGREYYWVFAGGNTTQGKVYSFDGKVGILMGAGAHGATACVKP